MEELPYQKFELIADPRETLELSEEARLIADMENIVETEVLEDRSLRLKVLDQCGMACTFCHNEGTPVTSDNVRREPGDFVSGGKSGRVSVFLGTNGADFVSGSVHDDLAFTDAVHSLTEAVPFNEVHLTGGEPTLHQELPDIIRRLHDDGNAVKITSNGELFYAKARELKEAGLDKVVFSIFGTTPAELAMVQGGKFANEKFAKLKLDALARSIEAAKEYGIRADANIVMPNLDHAERVMRVIEQFGDSCKIRILNSLDEGVESYEAVYEFLASIGATPIKKHLTAGASGMSVDYILPDGKIVGFKQIRKSYLPSVCDDCYFKNNGCDEGYYGVRMYVDQQNQYRVGVCIQRMDLTRPLDEFVRSNVPEAIVEHRRQEYDTIRKSLSLKGIESVES